MDKIKHGLIPALLIHLSIGFVYSWTVIATNIQDIFAGNSNFAFSLAIFFLGFSAAFMGDFVEKYNIKKSTCLSFLFFILGILVTSYAINIESLVLLYLGYGVLMGIGLGIGYITPIKNLILWFPNNNGFATGCAVTGFGLAASIASPLLKLIIPSFGVSLSLILIGGIYSVFMILALILIKKPIIDQIKEKVTFNYKKIIFSKPFIFIWTILFINILCGITLISNALTFLSVCNNNIIYITLILMGIFNGSGRLVIAWLSDYFKNRTSIFILIFIVSIISTSVGIIFKDGIWISLILLSATYGAGFSCLPLLIKSKFGINNLSKIHGLALTSWGIAGLVSSLFFESIKTLDINFLTVILILYLVSLLLTFKLLKK